MISISLLVILYQTTCFFSWISRLFHDTFLLQAHMQIHLWLFIPTSIISCKYLLYFNKFFSRLLFSCLDFFNQVFQNIFDYWKCKKNERQIQSKMTFRLSFSLNTQIEKENWRSRSLSLSHTLYFWLFVLYVLMNSLCCCCVSGFSFCAY